MRLNTLIVAFFIFYLAQFTRPEVLFDNAKRAGLQKEGLRTKPRPQGGDFSELQPGNGGLAVFVRNPVFRAGDDFVVSDLGWKIRSVTVYLTHPTFHSPSIKSGPIEIRSGTVTGSIVASGNVEKSEMTDIYRIFNNWMVDDYQIQRTKFKISGVLRPGYYWITFSVDPIPNMDGPFCPFLTKVGALTVPGANAMGRVSGPYIAWEPILDAGSLLPQDLPFIIEGQRLHSTGHSPTPTPFDIALSENFGILTK